jgi:(p)ppGpp synthase/HD superfamily hydrolase
MSRIQGATLGRLSPGDDVAPWRDSRQEAQLVAGAGPVSSLWDPAAYQTALRFAADAHGAQTLPGSSLPYVVHLANVAMEVMLAATRDASFDATFAIQVALLHDVLEDTSTPPAALEELFGVEVLQAVRALTKDSSMPKADKMRDSLARIRQARREAAIVKLADRITNLQPPPAHWLPEKRRAYLEEARQIHKALSGVQPWLEGRLSECIVAYAGWISEGAGPAA